MAFSNQARVPRTPTLPQGEQVAAYGTYLEAQRAVDHLADKQFPVQIVTIVGGDLRMVERVTGRLSYPRVALAGLASGAWFGLFVGFLLLLFSSPDGQTVPLLASILIGAAFGMLFSVVTYSFTGRQARLHVAEPDRRGVLLGAVRGGAGAQGSSAAPGDRRHDLGLADPAAGAGPGARPAVRPDRRLPARRPGDPVRGADGAARAPGPATRAPGPAAGAARPARADRPATGADRLTEPVTPPFAAVRAQAPLMWRARRAAQCRRPPGRSVPPTAPTGPSTSGRPPAARAP